MRFNEINSAGLSTKVQQPPQQAQPAPQQQPKQPGQQTKFIAPVQGYKISRQLSPIHNGVDLSVPVGTPLVAPEDGTIADEGRWKYAGEMIKLVSADGTREHKLMHLDNNSITVYKGQKVKAGQQIAKSGNTGFSTGPHLHWEMRVNGKLANPLDFI